jgi:hypothetical protein
MAGRTTSHGLCASCNDPIWVIKKIDSGRISLCPPCLGKLKHSWGGMEYRRESFLQWILRAGVEFDGSRNQQMAEGVRARAAQAGIRRTQR